MDAQLLYQSDPTVLEFEAAVLEILDLPDGRLGVVLDRTYFYPTGGGQEHDTGTIGYARVVDVFKDDANARLVHVVEGQVAPGAVMVRIDADRRLRHMQSHTAQHLLTQCILRQAGFETVSANINGYSPSTLDILSENISPSDLEQAELLANRVIYENRPVKTYFVSPGELQSIPLRRPPKVTENIRIVEIDGFDYSPCGGTHVQRTGSLGVVKVLKSERQNDRTRIYFLAGSQAVELFRQMYTALSDLAAQWSTGWQDIPVIFARQAGQLAAAQKELQVLRQAAIELEARRLADGAEILSGVKLIRASFTGRPVAELRLLAEQFKQVPALVAYLSSYEGQKVSLVVTCGEGSGTDARQLLTRLLDQINGRGGGDARLAQGGGAATPAQYSTFLQHVVLD